MPFSRRKKPHEIGFSGSFCSLAEVYGGYSLVLLYAVRSSRGPYLSFGSENLTDLDAKSPRKAFSLAMRGGSKIDCALAW